MQDIAKRLGRVLVTGADGFIGSHLTRMLLEQGCRVRALVQYNSWGLRGRLEGVEHPSLEVVAGDIRDPHQCIDLCRDIDTVMHLAALIAIPYSYQAPDSYVATNIGGTLNMLQAARMQHCRRILVTSTSEVYGTARQVPIPETHPRQPQSPYSATKIGADALALSFYNAFATPVVVVRPFNTYGPGQSARAFIPTVITQIANGMREIKVGDLRPTRDFNYVTDTCRGFIALATAPDQEVLGREINIATGTEVSMAHTLEMIARLMQADVQWITDPQRLRPATSEVMRLCGDARLITSITSWRPEVTLEEGLHRTIQWFTLPAHLSQYKANIYNQ